MNLEQIKKIYFIGIKGVAMSGLAVICKQKGLEVAGSDVPEKFITDKILKNYQIKIFSEFNPKNLLDFAPDLVVCGASWDESNPEVEVVKNKKIPMIIESELRGLLSQQKETIAVCGIHGKTTTTALLSWIFKFAGLDPSYLIGSGLVPDLAGNAYWGKGKHFIVEGDEYIKSKKDQRPKFLDLEPKISIITNVEWEHVDIYPTLKEISQAFRKLIKKTKEMIVACSDSLELKKIIQGHDNKIVTYGFLEDNLYQIYNFRQIGNKIIFEIRKEGVSLEEFEVNLLGKHNALNALACIIVSLKEGIELEKIRQALENFQGLERRIDAKEYKGIIFIDDYAHHPTEIKATLKAIRDRFKDKVIWCVFQPHMASRTKAFLNDFTQSFSKIDKVIFSDIFASAREKAEDVTSKDLAEATKKYHQDVVYTGDLNQTINYLKDKIKPGEVLITMGAGDIYKVRDKLLENL